jgi:chromosome segregation ATPase
MADTTSQLGELEINIRQQTTTVEKTSTMLEQQESHIIEVKGDVRTIKDGWSEMQTRFKETMRSLEKKKDSSNELMDLLKQLSGKIETISQQQQSNSFSGNGNSTGDGSSSSVLEDITHAVDTELLESIKRLSQLVSEEEQVVPTDHITEILEDLSALIRAPLTLQPKDEKANMRTYASGLRGPSKTLSQSRTLKQIEGLFSSSFHVAINKGGK